jgi:hypothetical protein
MTVSQKLQVARNLIAQGWAAGYMVSRGMDGHTKYCARGALNKAFLGRATTDAEFTPSVELRLAQWLVAEAMEGRFLVETEPTAVRVAIRTWNDSQAGPRAQARVVAAFDAAIAKCRAMEDDAEKALAEVEVAAPPVAPPVAASPVPLSGSHHRREPALTPTAALTGPNQTHLSPGRHRAHGVDRLYRPSLANHADDGPRHNGHRSGTSNPRPPTHVAQRGPWTANRPCQATPRGVPELSAARTGEAAPRT